MNGLMAPEEIKPGARHNSKRHGWDNWRAALCLWEDEDLVKCARRAWKSYGSRSIRAQYAALSDARELSAEWRRRHEGSDPTYWTILRETDWAEELASAD